MVIEHNFIIALGYAATAFHVLGALSAVRAVMSARTSQGAVAWAIALVTFPYLALPMYWIFGNSKFEGYVIARKNHDLRVGFLRELFKPLNPEQLAAIPAPLSFVSVCEDLASFPFTLGNSSQLCINGEQTFAEMFKIFDAAQSYLLVQFFIIKNDEIGGAFKQKLEDAARRGVRVYLIFDDVGSRPLPEKYVAELREQGVRVSVFKTNRGFRNRLRINFRNHRKIVVADGQVAMVGGLNVGDEYLGKGSMGFWRDTHLRLEGPAVKQVQVSFAEDWHWAQNEVLGLDWEVRNHASSNQAILILPTGPADTLETCSLCFQELIHNAKSRVWITSPYFVPDQSIVSSLQLAAMRGVDVRIILPNRADHYFVYWASFSYLKDVLPYGVKIYRYKNGFTHQKVILVDDNLATVGTANFDNRSFRLNFEITVCVADRAFNSQVEAMFVADFRECVVAKIEEYTDRRYVSKFLVQFSRLLSPVL